MEKENGKKAVREKEGRSVGGERQMAFLSVRGLSFAGKGGTKLRGGKKNIGSDLWEKT